MLYTLLLSFIDNVSFQVGFLCGVFKLSTFVGEFFEIKNFVLIQMLLDRSSPFVRYKRTDDKFWMKICLNTEWKHVKRYEKQRR